MVVAAAAGCAAPSQTPRDARTPSAATHWFVRLIIRRLSTTALNLESVRRARKP